MNNIVRLSDYRKPSPKPEKERWPSPDELAAWPYSSIIGWAYDSFDRLLAAAKAKDFPPEWVPNTLANYGKTLTPRQAAIIARLSAQRGRQGARRRRTK
jgi:hypothetical protein